jgi:hypothetical protein
VTIRGKLYTAIVVVVAGLALTVGVAVWTMNRLGDRFDEVQRAAEARALALQLKFDVTDFNGWQTAYGYDGGKSRPAYLEAFTRFQRNLARARSELQEPGENRLLDRIESAAEDFGELDDLAWGALQANRMDDVRRILLGPELENFERAASAAQELADVEAARAAAQDRVFEDARKDALRFLLGASIIATLLVVILLVAATDLARQAERPRGP